MRRNYKCSRDEIFIRRGFEQAGVFDAKAQNMMLWFDDCFCLCFGQECVRLSLALNHCYLIRHVLSFWL